MRISITRKYFITVAAISFGIGILIEFNSILYLFMADVAGMERNLQDESISHVVSNLLTTTIFTFFVFVLNFYIVRPLKPREKAGTKNVLWAVFLTLAAVLLLSELFFFLNHLITGQSSSGGFHLVYIFKDIFIGLVVLISVYIFKVFNEKQAILIENEKLKLENLQSRYQTLKNQVSPHFLFNSLTALTELIDENTANARNYVRHLSQVLRYTLQSNENQTVSLLEEMETVKSYLFLLKMRFGDNLKVEFQMDKPLEIYSVPPLVVQTLIENAVKHNEVSKRHNLQIKIEITENEGLAVSNTLRGRKTQEQGMGIGLTNLSKQYQLLCGEDISIFKSEHEFRIEVPLLKQVENEGNNSRR